MSQEDWNEIIPSKEDLKKEQQMSEPIGVVVREGLFCTECPNYDSCELECNDLDQKQEGENE